MKRFVEIGAPIEQRLSASALSRAANAVAGLLRVQLLPLTAHPDAASDPANPADPSDAGVARWPVWGAVLRAAAPGTVVFAAVWGAIVLRVAYMVLVRVRATRMLREAHASTS